MSLGLIADDQGRRHHLPAPIHHLIRTRMRNRIRQKTTISVDRNLPTMYEYIVCLWGGVPGPVDLINAA